MTLRLLKSHTRLLTALGLLLLPGLLSGCTATGVAVGAAATGGIFAAQERSVGDGVDDTVIRLAVNEKILSTDASLFQNVSITVVEGRVLLTGFVENAEQRAKATRLAWQGSEKIVEVINELNTTDSGGIVTYSEDAWITTQLRGKLLQDSNIYDINYSITTNGGIIYLMGIAQNSSELSRVTDYARAIKGVVKVISYVRMKDDPRRRRS